MEKQIRKLAWKYFWKQKFFPLRPCHWDFGVAKPLDPKKLHGCLYFHTKAAKMNGATDEEIAETAFLARFTTGWSDMIHAAGIDLEEFKKQIDQVEAYLTKK